MVSAPVIVPALTHPLHTVSLYDHRDLTISPTTCNAPACHVEGTQSLGHNARAFMSNNDVNTSIPVSDTSSSVDERSNHTQITSTIPIQPRPLPLGTRVCVVGVGFVGKSLLDEFGTVVPSLGFDISSKRIEDLKNAFNSMEKVSLTSDENQLRNATHFLIAVPTLLRADRSINSEYVERAVATVVKHAAPGSTIVIESSVSVGMTRALLGRYAALFHCGMSPERVDPGRIKPTARAIPKLVSGITPSALQAITALYSQAYTTVVPLSSCEAAEMTKLHENCFRMVNIAYANEIGDACRTLGLDPHEVIAAASTKPYGFMPFYPGLGVGGHCIPVNPYYLFSSCKSLPVLERATKLMWARPRRLAKAFHRRCVIHIKASRRPNSSEQVELPHAPAGLLPQPRILVIGIAFKPGERVTSFSPGLGFAEALQNLGCARLAFYDPLVPAADVPWMERWGDSDFVEVEKGGHGTGNFWTQRALEASFDGIAICMNQAGVDLNVVKRSRRCFVRSFV